jgi:hypothetical protein
MEPILVELPKNMTTAQAAEHFTAYLLGATVFNNQKNAFGDWIHGPTWNDAGTGKWILGHMNDFWLREVEPGTVALSCRYEPYYALLKAMVVLFQHNFGLYEDLHSKAEA